MNLKTHQMNVEAMAAIKVRLAKSETLRRALEQALDYEYGDAEQDALVGAELDAARAVAHLESEIDALRDMYPTTCPNCDINRLAEFVEPDADGFRPVLLQAGPNRACELCHGSGEVIIE